MNWNPFNNTLGLALGGGAAKGVAHIGVLKAFEENNITIDFLAGTSVGAIIASYYAFGKTTEEIRTIESKLSFTSLTSLKIQKKGIFSTDSIKKMIIHDLGDVNIEDAKIPLAICATDIYNGEQVVLTSGNLANAVCASTAVPGIYVPVEINGRLLVDGGISENVPISLLEHLGAGITFGVDLNGQANYLEPNDMVSIIGNAIDIAIDQRTKSQLKQADFVLSFDLTSFNRFANFNKTDEIFNLGYKSAKKKLKQFHLYKKIRYFLYIKKLLSEIVPIKLPEILKLKK